MPAKILIVDDEPDLLDLLRHEFAQSGYHTETATSGIEALHKAERSPPDLVVLDLVLPELNGYGVCEVLRRLPTTAHVPIIMMTVLPGEFPRLAGLEAGADAYVHKPFQVQELLSRVDDLLAKGSPSQPSRQEMCRLAA